MFYCKHKDLAVPGDKVLLGNYRGLKLTEHVM